MSTIEKYGYFDDAQQCFVVVEEPPRKWRNIHYNAIGDDEVYAETSNISDGPVRVRDAQGVTCELVGWDAKYVYIRDDDEGIAFCPWGAPAPQRVHNRQCRFYAAKTEITSECNDLRVTHRVFVPRAYTMEIWTVTVQNLRTVPRRISVFAYAMFQLTGCDAEGRYVGKENYAEVLPEIGGTFITNRNVEVPSPRFKGYLVALNHFFAGNGYRDQFTRSEYSLGTPRLLWGWDCDNQPGYGPDCAGVVQTKLTIPPHGSGRVDFLLGQAASPEEVRRVRAELSPARIDALCDEQMTIELKRANAFRVSTGNPHYDGLINIFVKKQMYSYLINKSGFRDNLQTDCGLALADYLTAEANLLRALAAQRPDGSVLHSFRPLNRHRYSDKPAWIMMAVPLLIQESARMELLDVEVPYFESSEKGTVWDHMLRAMRHLAHDTGRHGLCRQHYADWNDGLEATKEAGERESVMVTQQLCYGVLEVAELARRRGDRAVEEEAKTIHRTFYERLNDVAWDGRWYVRTICEDGYKIGSHKNAEGKIFLNTQSWAILSRTAPPDRAALCMAAVDEFLRCDLGYRICYPGFSQYDPRVGRMSNSMPGHVENGGCYNHAAGFKGVADCLLGRAEEAWETFVKVAPDNPLNPVSHSGVEPFSFTNSYSMCKYVYGQAGYPWRTGTAAWMTMLLVEWILGARRSYEGLMIDPCLTKTIPRASLERTFRGARFIIELDNTAGRCRGAREIIFNGSKLRSNVLPDLRAGVHTVQVII